MLPSGLVTLESASAEPFETNVSADVQLLPGRRMICEVALHNHGDGEWYERPSCMLDVPSLTDRRDRGLDTVSPSVDIGYIVGLVHPTLEMSTDPLQYSREGMLRTRRR